MSILIVSIAIKLKGTGRFRHHALLWKVLTRLMVTNVRVCDSSEQLGGRGVSKNIQNGC